MTKPNPHALVGALLVCILSSGAAAQQSSAPAAGGKQATAPTNILVPYRKGSKWGYSTLQKKIVIAPQYDGAAVFFDGLAVVTVDHKAGYIDQTGKLMIPAQFDKAWGFSDGFARVEVNGKFGRINKTGAFVMPAKYDTIGPPSEGMIVVQQGKQWAAFDNAGHQITPFGDLTIDDFHDSRAMVWDPYVEPAPGSNPPAQAVIKSGEPEKPPDGGRRCGYIDKAGHQVIPKKYYRCSDFSEGLASVLTAPPGIDTPDMPPTDSVAFIDTSGKVVIPAITARCCPSFHSGLAQVGQVYLDKTGKKAISPPYDELFDFSEGLALVETGGIPKEAPPDAQTGRKYGYIDKAGKLVVPLRAYDNLSLWTMGQFHEGLAAVRQNGKFGFIDKTGKLVIDFKYAGVTDFSNGLAQVYTADNPITVLSSPDPDQYFVGFIGRDGTEYFEP